MTYQCPKGHQSSDSDYCSECGALIGQSKISSVELSSSSSLNSLNSGGTVSSQDICPDCGTPRVLDARFCEVCRHDFQDNKTGVAEVIVASSAPQTSNLTANGADTEETKDELVISQKLNVVISVDKGKVSSCGIDTAIKPDNVERVFPLDLDENLLGRRSTGKGIFPEIEINDPGVSHRHLKFIKQNDGSFAVLELGSANGTELNGVILEPGVHTTVKAGDELVIGIWTQLKLVSR